MNNMKNYDSGRFMRELRKKTGKTTEQIAEEVDTSRQTISNWESGKTLPMKENFRKVIRAYDLSIEDYRRLFGLPDADKGDNSILPIVKASEKTFDKYKSKIAKYFEESEHSTEYPTNLHIEVADFIRYVLGGKYYDTQQPEGKPGDTQDLTEVFRIGQLLYGTMPFGLSVKEAFINGYLAQYLEDQGFAVLKSSDDMLDGLFVLAISKSQAEKLSLEIYKALFMSDTNSLRRQPRMVFEGLMEECNKINKDISDFQKKVSNSALGDLPDWIDLEDHENKVVLYYIDLSKEEPHQIEALYSANNIDDMFEGLSGCITEIRELTDGENTAFGVVDYRDGVNDDVAKYMTADANSDSLMEYCGAEFVYSHVLKDETETEDDG